VTLNLRTGAAEPEMIGPFPLFSRASYHSFVIERGLVGTIRQTCGEGSIFTAWKRSGRTGSEIESTQGGGDESPRKSLASSLTVTFNVRLLTRYGRRLSRKRSHRGQKVTISTISLRKKIYLYILRPLLEGGVGEGNGGGEKPGGRERR